MLAGPAALYLFGPTGERFFPGSCDGFDGAPQSFADLLDRFVAADVTVLDRAVARLRTDGTSFDVRLRLAKTGQAIEVRRQMATSPGIKVRRPAIGCGAMRCGSPMAPPALPPSASRRG